jgi:hypothetical protein
MICPARIEREQLKATYIKVAELIGLKTDEQEKAKVFLREFAKERNLTINDLFDGYNEVLDTYISQRELDGYYDY